MKDIGNIITKLRELAQQEDVCGAQYRAQQLDNNFIQSWIKVENEIIETKSLLIKEIVDDEFTDNEEFVTQLNEAIVAHKKTVQMLQNQLKINDDVAMKLSKRKVDIKAN